MPENLQQPLPPIAPAYSGATVPTNSALRRRFETLAQQWKEDTQFTSSATELISHPAYREIIGMGWEALPFLFAELRREPDHWFTALHEITGANPVALADRGKLSKMTEAWLAWAQEQGL